MIVLDSSAILAFLLGEPGCDTVASHLADACLSTVILTETIGRLARGGIDAAPVLALVASQSMQVISFGLNQTRIAGSLIMPGRSLGLSLGDCCCLALAIERELAVLTSDRVWLALPLPIAIKLIR